MEWRAWEKLNGPILVHERVDIGLARIAAVLTNGKVLEHMPPWYSEQVADVRTRAAFERLRLLAQQGGS